MKVESQRISEISDESGQQAQSDQRGNQNRRQHTGAVRQPLLRQEDWIFGEVHINSLAPDCRKICSRSSPLPRHSVTRTPSITRVFNNPSSASASPSNSNVAPWAAVSRFLTPAPFKICRALSSALRHLTDIWRRPIFCPSSAIVPKATNRPRSL